MSDIDCADCRTLWRNYAEATAKYGNVESQQKKAASSGYLNLFKELTEQLHRLEVQREECRMQIGSHVQERHGTMTRAFSTA